MKFTTNLSIFLITFFISSNFKITAQGIDNTTSVETLINSTLENASSTEPQSSNQQPTSTVHSTHDPQFSTSTLTIAKQAAATNLPPLPPSQQSTSTNTSATDFPLWSTSPSTPPELTTPQITNRSDHELTSWQHNATNSTFQPELDSTPADPSPNVTDTPNATLIVPTDGQNVSTPDAPINSTEGNENGTTTSFQVVDNNSTDPSTNASTENNNTEIESNVTSVPESVSESVSANGTSPSTRNSTERFSDVDATPLHETASMTSSSSLPSGTFSAEPETTTKKPRAATKKWFMLQFTGNCTEMEHKFEDFKKQIHEKILSKAGIPDHQVTLNAINCTNSFLLNVSVSPESEGQLAQFFSNLESTTNSSNKFRISDETYLLNVVNSVGDNAYHQPPEVTLSSKHTDIEFVIYVALGSACVFLLTLAVILVACKYCRSKPYKSFDLNDISHLSLGLEDFTLTRIPRPKSTSIYNDFATNKNQYSPIDQQGGGGNGMVHSYDTSVVPLEDAPNFKSENESEPRIVGKSTQTSPTNHEYEEIDVKAVKSTENLHSAPKPASKHWGVDNASFSTP